MNRHKRPEQESLPGLDVVVNRRPVRTRRQSRYHLDLSSSGPIGGHMPIFDLETGAEIMNVVDRGATITIYVENMDPDGHPQQLIPREITRQEYLEMRRRQPKIHRMHRNAL